MEPLIHPAAGPPLSSDQQINPSHTRCESSGEFDGKPRPRRRRVRRKLPRPEFLSMDQLWEVVGDEEKARDWMERAIWGDHPVCPRCGGTDGVRPAQDKNRQPYHCGRCRYYFSVRVGTVMQGSHVPLRKWILAMYELLTNRTGISSCQLAKVLGVTQKTA